MLQKKQQNAPLVWKKNMSLGSVRVPIVKSTPLTYHVLTESLLSHYIFLIFIVYLADDLLYYLDTL